MKKLISLTSFSYLYNFEFILIKQTIGDKWYSVPKTLTLKSVKGQGNNAIKVLSLKTIYAKYECQYLKR